MEQLQALGVVHVGGNLGADLIDIDLLAVEPVQQAHRLVHGLLAEVLPDEAAHDVQFPLVHAAVGLDDGRGQHEQAHHEAVALLRCGVGPGGALIRGAALPIRVHPGIELPDRVQAALDEGAEQETDQRADELIEQMGLSHIKDHLPAQCSGGEQQRCAVARAIIHEPELLFADEPTGALNKRNTTEVLDLLTALNAAGQSILMVTHDARAALRASRIIYISDGKVVSELTLSPYTAESEKHREAQVTAWLAALEW